MKNLMLALSSFVCLCIAQIVFGEGDGNVALKACISKFGRSTTYEDVASLRNNPHDALALLVGELHPVPSGKVSLDSSETDMHVIWCLRALRYLTGIKQYGDIQNLEELVDKETAYWLTIDTAGVPFFSTKMSTDTVYIAPSSIQMQIIGKWKQIIEGKKYEIKSGVHLNTWYF